MIKLIKNTEIKKKIIEDSGFKSQFSFDPVSDTELFSAEAGEYIITEGVRLQYLYYMCSGRAKLYMTLSNGKIALIDFFTAPCFIGEMELLTDTGEVRAVQAIEKCMCLALPLKRYRERLLKDSCFLLNLCRLLGNKNCRNIISFTRNQAFPLANRLASFILLTEEDGIYHEKHTLTAEYLGISYRHLLFVLADFTDKGYLAKDKRRYVICNRAALEKLAGEIK